MGGAEMKKYFLIYMAIVLGFGAGVFVPHTALAQDKADKVRAVFLFKFFDYVTWPSGKKPGKDGNGVLCTYGKNPFGNSLEYISARKGGKYTLQTKNITSPDDAKGCHVLYITRANYEEIQKITENKGILIVGDSKEFLDHGGIISLQENSSKVGLAIDLKNAKKTKPKNQFAAFKNRRSEKIRKKTDNVEKIQKRINQK